jgi:hypothetical protein
MPVMKRTYAKRIEERQKKLKYNEGKNLNTKFDGANYFRLPRRSRISR